jgi:glycosyltransferase involved in cell wall biosynthesis
MPELSIIVPVYKVEKYLPKCLDSILAQTFKDYELILIDDGSPDRCGRICDEYAVRDSRITVIHQGNEGVSSARNKGLAIAKGRYVTFVDSDDAVDTNAYDAMLLKAKTSASDIVSCGVQYYTENGVFKRRDLTVECVCNQAEMLEAMFDLPNRLGGSCCNKIFRRDMIADLRYEETVSMGEDWLFLFQAFLRAKKLYKMKETFYWVTEHANSSARRQDPDIPVKILKSSKRMMIMANRYSHPLGCKATNKYLDDCFRYSRQIKKIGIQEHKPYRLKRIRCAFDIIGVLIISFFSGKLSKEQRHRYVYELIHY